MNRARGPALGTVAYWGTPFLVCLAVHWLGFTAWFRADDFAWLGNAASVHSWHDLWIALFYPRAQGTIRFFSERAFFLAGYSLFGLNALPFRLVIFATQFADLALVAAIGSRLTGRRAAGFLAAMLWGINSASSQPLGWACVYNEVLSAFFLLLAFYCLLRYIETGERRYHWYQWGAFLLGFGALELNVVYPALAAGYTWLCARKRFRGTLPLFAASAAYTAIHMAAAPVLKTGVYAMHFTSSMLRTLAIYWTWSVGPTYLSMPFHVRRWILWAGIWALSLALLAFLARSLRAGERTALFCVWWYMVTIAPLLPLRDHLTEYYPYIPVIGLCWLGAWALAWAWEQGTGRRVLAVALAGVYCFLMLPRSWSGAQWNYDLTMQSQKLVAGVARAQELHPNRAILLVGANYDQYWNVIQAHTFRLVGAERVYLAPGSAKRMVLPEPDAEIPGYELPGAVAAKALERDELVVYDVRGQTLRNITTSYADALADRTLPLRIDVADPLTGYLLGPEWYPAEGDHRWMPKRAVLRMGAPETPGQSLHVRGFCPEARLREGPVLLTVRVDGVALPEAAVRGSSFDLAFALPAAVAGKAEMQVAVEVNRTFRPAGDSRELGVVFGVFEVR